MSPTFIPGDRILCLKTRLPGPVGRFVKTRYNAPVLFAQRFSDSLGCLRIAGSPGDTVRIASGKLTLINKPNFISRAIHCDLESLPPDYSPRDNMGDVMLPTPGTLINLDSLPLQENVFIISMIQQQLGTKSVQITPMLFIDGKPSNTYQIRNFPLYAGDFSSIPVSYLNNWFFWDRLLSYFQTVLEDRTVSISFSVTIKGEVIHEWTVRDHFYFLAADNWCNGLDSRYFGPVSREAITGRILCILWSLDPDKKGFFLKRLHVGRICKLVS
jgi:signal peptidase I